MSTPEEREFWKRAYIAAVHRGHPFPKDAADRAASDFRKTFRDDLAKWLDNQSRKT